MSPSPAQDSYLRQSGRRGRVRGSRGSSCGLWSFVHFMGLCIRIPLLSAGTGTMGISWRWQHPRHLSPVHVSTKICKSPAPQPTIVKSGISRAPQTASHQGMDPRPPPPAPLGHGEDGVGTAKSPSLGRSSHPSEQTPHHAPNPAMPTSRTDPPKVTPQSLSGPYTKLGTSAHDPPPAPRPPLTPGGWVGRRHPGVSRAQLHPG